MSSRFRNTILLLVLTAALVLLFVYNEDKWDAFIQFSLLLICLPLTELCILLLSKVKRKGKELIKPQETRKHPKGLVGMNLLLLFILLLHFVVALVLHQKGYPLYAGVLSLLLLFGGTIVVLVLYKGSLRSAGRS